MAKHSDPTWISAGVLVENLIFIGAIAFSKSFYRLPDNGPAIVAGQVLLALFTGIFPFMWIRFLHRAWDKWYTEFMEKEKQNGV